MISHWKEDKSVHCTGKIFKLSKSTVFNIIDRFKKINSVDKKQRSGRPKIFNEHEERWIVRQVCANPRISAVKMTLKCKSRFGKSVNPETVRNVLRKHKYHGRVPQRKPYISKANRQARLAFAKMYVKQPTKIWENVILVDKSKYNIFKSDGKQKFGGNQIQQCMSKIYGLLSNMELSGAT
ncbi:HTH_Tnp_Tc3_2 domain-containing protein [Trichonephila clavipes]|uniref:HTH_Tnp_Tc3_2 domain-containing protein n=1 Tax=Trichonephila clavipes TaxID=2585209 RepID=A0A8X6V913_TRICX|nr:HTH_Tnp_Tc3_2 domain-containing protein [Trichonephila clavipes]